MVILLTKLNKNYFFPHKVFIFVPIKKKDKNWLGKTSCKSHLNLQIVTQTFKQVLFTGYKTKQTNCVFFPLPSFFFKTPGKKKKKEKEKPKPQCQNEREKRETFKEENPLIASSGEARRESESEGKGKQSRWCHLMTSNPPLPLATVPSLNAFDSIVLEHALHDDRFDFAYSATIDERGILSSSGFRFGVHQKGRFETGEEARCAKRGRRAESGTGKKREVIGLGRRCGRLGRLAVTLNKNLGMVSMEIFHYCILLLIPGLKVSRHISVLIEWCNGDPSFFSSFFLNYFTDPIVLLNF